MTNRQDIINIIRETYAARVRGDHKGVMAAFADDAVFSMNGRGTGIQGMGEACAGRAAVGATLGSLIDVFRFDNWKELTLLVDDDHAFLHWSADVTFIPTGKKEHFDVFDNFEFRDGKIVSLQQATDTAMIVALTSAS